MAVEGVEAFSSESQRWKAVPPMESTPSGMMASLRPEPQKEYGPMVRSEEGKFIDCSFTACQNEELSSVTAPGICT